MTRFLAALGRTAKRVKQAFIFRERRKPFNLGTYLMIRRNQSCEIEMDTWSEY